MTMQALAAAHASSVADLYERECARHGYTPDRAQRNVVDLYDDLRARLIKAPPHKGLLGSLLGRTRSRTLERGLYIWGGVGRGKTWIMDLFFHSLPFRDKQRVHFHRFMQFVHDELKKHHDRADPLDSVADTIARKSRVLCFDEFFVSDIADAMLVATLLEGLFERGVTLVATSNAQPDNLYKDGLQRARFLPAIKLLKQHTRVVHMDGGADYRLRLLEKATTWFTSDAHANAALTRLFDEIADAPGKIDSTLILNHRRLHAHRRAEEVIWFTFKELCDGPRSQADYIEIARCFHTVILSGIPVLDSTMENQARRLITLVDEFYDRGVKLIVSAAANVDALYRGSRLTFEFERTKSRLIEMQTQAYLARPHQP